MPMQTDDYLQQLHSPVREVATTLCNIIRQHPQALVETIKWQVPVFSVNHHVCSVIAHKAHVNLQFFNGAHIAGSAELTGTGKDMRHIKFTTVDDIRQQQITRLLDQAIEYDRAT
ncbi:MAG: DUF1801 domain-containing protein [Pseudomonadota bacterium]